MLNNKTKQFDTVVLKFGGAAVASIEQFSTIANIIIEKKHLCPRLVVVVSAMGETTNQLIDLAKQVHPSPPQREYDMLISAGERISMSLLAMALCQRNCEAVSFTGSQSGIITSADHSNASIIDVRPNRLLSALKENKVVIVAGFQGVSLEKEITTLGRGGSDTTAVALAIALEADCVEFYKDVPGVFDRDPKLYDNTRQYESLSYVDALAIVRNGARILHPRAIQLAAMNALPLHVKSFQDKHREVAGTWIDDPSHQRPQYPLFEQVLVC